MIEKKCYIRKKGNIINNVYFNVFVGSIFSFSKQAHKHAENIRNRMLWKTKALTTNGRKNWNKKKVRDRPKINRIEKQNDRSELYFCIRFGFLLLASTENLTENEILFFCIALLSQFFVFNFLNCRILNRSTNKIKPHFSWETICSHKSTNLFENWFFVCCTFSISLSVLLFVVLFYFIYFFFAYFLVRSKQIIEFSCLSKTQSRLDSIYEK